MIIKVITKIMALALVAFGVSFAQVESAQAKMPTIPQCVKAYKVLQSKKALPAAKRLIATDCAVMYKSKWLIGKGVSNPKACAPAWKSLGKKKLLGAVRELVTRNCPVIYKMHWRKVN